MLAAKVRPRTRPADRQKEAVPGGSCIPYGAGPHSDFMPRSIVQRARGSLAPDRGRGTRSETWPLGAPAGQGPVFAELRRVLSRMRGTRRRSKGRTLGGDRRAQRANCLATVAAATNRFLLTLSVGHCRGASGGANWEALSTRSPSPGRARSATRRGACASGPPSAAPRTAGPPSPCGSRGAPRRGHGAAPQA